jgi:hypothetical protein
MYITSENDAPSFAALPGAAFLFAGRRWGGVVAEQLKVAGSRSLLLALAGHHVPCLNF